MTRRNAKPPADLPPQDLRALDDPALKPKNGDPHHQHGLDKIPPGFTRYRGKGDPFGTPDGEIPPPAMLVIRTAHGYSTSGPRLVHPDEWALPAKELGSIAAYRRVPEPERPAGVSAVRPPWLKQ